MHVTVLHHHPLPQKGLPLSGSSIRLGHLIEGLQQRLPELTLTWLCKSNVEGNWKNHIWNHLSSTQADGVLCAQLEDVSLLPPRDQSKIPVIVDLYAPRLMEALYESDDGSCSQATVLALSRADAYLYSHSLQLDHWQALLRMVGVDEITSRCLLTPLGIDAEPSLNKSDILRLVGGGRVWPWQNPWNNLTKLLNILDQFESGEVHWFTPPDVTVPLEHPRLTVQPWTSRTAYRAVLKTAHFGLDLNPNTPERHLACAFRHMEMLGCGLPILSTNTNILSRSEPKLCTVIDLEKPKSVFKKLSQWNNPPKTSIQTIQQLHSPVNLVNDLAKWLNHPTTRTPNCHRVVDVLRSTQQEVDAQNQVEELTLQIESLEKTRTEQTRLLQEANQQIQDSSASILKMATAIEQVSAFKNDIAHNWSNLLHEQQQTITALQEQIQSMHSDNAKKSAELLAMDQLRERLENDLKHVRDELANRPQSRWR